MNYDYYRIDGRHPIDNLRDVLERVHGTMRGCLHLMEFKEVAPYLTIDSMELGEDCIPHLISFIDTPKGKKAFTSLFKDIDSYLIARNNAVTAKQQAAKITPTPEAVEKTGARKMPPSPSEIRKLKQTAYRNFLSEFSEYRFR